MIIIVALHIILVVWIVIMFSELNAWRVEQKERLARIKQREKNLMDMLASKKKGLLK